MPEDALRRPSLRARTLGAVLGATCLVVPLLVAAAPASAVPASATVAHGSAADVPREEAPRTIVTTDPELDDLNSLLRMLLYGNEINLAGLVYSASQHHYEGDPDRGIDPHRWPEPDSVFHIDEAVDRYEEVYPNLVVHDAAYPSPDELRSLIAWGNVAEVGEMDADTDGSELIKDILLDDEPGQVFLQAWGGANTIARALKSIQDDFEDTPEWDAIHEKVSQKAVLTSFGQQDDTFFDYIRPNWPELEHREVATSIWGYGARGSALPEWQEYLGPEWTETNVSSVGPLGDSYRVWGDGKQMAAGFDNEDYFGLSGYTADELRGMGYMVWTPPQPKGAWISEGDSSNWALLVQNGLRNHEDPSWGGWGGRQEQNPDDPHQWRNRGVTDIGPDGQPRSDYSAARWFEDFQLDFAARLQWSVTSDFDDVNHSPAAAVAEGVDLNLVPGQEYTLNGTATDADGDGVSLDWWQYVEAGTYDGAVALNQGDPGAVTFTVPEDAEPGDTIHLILEAEDDGAPVLKHWQRVVVTVVDAYSPVVDEVSTTASTTGVTPITVTGAELFDVTAVSTGEAEAPADVATDGRSLTFTAPASEIAGAVSASLVGGEGASFELEYAAPTVTSVAPARGPAAGDQEVVLAGTDLALAEEVLFGDASGSDVSASADALMVTTPESADGATDVTVVLPGVDVVLQDAYIFTTVDVAVSSDSVQAGDDLDVSATGFGAGEEVEIRLHSDPVRLANATADAAGVVEARVTIPVGTEVGDHEIVAQGVESGSGAVSLTVTSPSGTGGGSGDDDLATTGGDAPWGIALGGLALLILGAGAFVLRRRSGLSAG